MRFRKHYIAKVKTLISSNRCTKLEIEHEWQGELVPLGIVVEHKVDTRVAKIADTWSDSPSLCQFSCAQHIDIVDRIADPNCETRGDTLIFMTI